MDSTDALATFIDIDSVAVEMSQQQPMVQAGFAVIDENKEFFNSYLGSMLRTIAQRRGVSVGSLCERSGISRSTLSRYFRGDTSISLYHFIVLCRILDCSPSAVCIRCATHMFEGFNGEGFPRSAFRV